MREKKLPFNSRATMTSTPNKSLPARSQGHHTTTQHTSTPEFFRLLDFLQEEGPVRSSRSPSVAVPAPAARHEGLNTTAGSEHNVSCETRSRASAHLGPSGETRSASTAPRFFEEQDRVSTNPTDRVSRFEEPNDVTGRALWSFRKSPCPPRRRSSSTAQDSA